MTNLKGHWVRRWLAYENPVPISVARLGVDVDPSPGRARIDSAEPCRQYSLYFCPPGSVDVFLILLSAHRRAWWAYYALMATLGEVLGGYLDLPDG